MQQDWKIKQEIYHRLNNQHDDDLSLHTIEITEDIVDSAVRYFLENTQGWVYPAKSYVVAICYARWLSKDYNEDLYELLNDPDLLYGNDPYFVTYSSDPGTYDSIIKEIGGWSFDETKGIIPDVRKYFEEEFMI
jgi:hypothetical protein